MGKVCYHRPMWLDISEFHRFYRTELGMTVQHVLNRRLAKLWPDVTQQNVAIYGYGIPYLEVFRQQAARAFAIMPAPMGVTHWPESRPNLTVLCEETCLPLADQSLDKLVLIHALEHSHYTCTLLREAWRVLKDGGRLMIVAPNRRGIWARTVSTPFGHGQPYTGQQLFSLLQTNALTPDKPHYSLFIPPAAPHFFNNIHESLERFGRRWGKKLGGVVIIEAHKMTLSTISNQPASPWHPKIYVPQIFDLK